MENLDSTPIIDVPYFDKDRYVSPLNFAESVHPCEMSRGIYIHDVTLRDGEQTPGVVWREDERIRIALALNDIGIQEIEVGMPIVPEIKRVTQQLVHMDLQAKIVPFARARQDDIDAALEAGAQSIVVEHCINPYICRYTYGLDEKGMINRCIRWVRYAKENGLRTTFMPWDTTRVSYEFLWKVCEAVVEETAPDALVITDSFGVASPFAILRVVRGLKKSFPHLPLELHIHNEFGMAMGSVVAAVAGGIDGIHSSFNGLGERTGNVATEQVVAAMEILFGINTGVQLNKLCSVSRLVQELAKVRVAPNAPVVGDRLFTVESGVVTQIIQEMTAAGCKTGMTPYAPELVGHDPYELVLGKGTGRNTIGLFLQQIGIEATEEQQAKILDRVRAEATLRKALLSLEDLRVIAGEVMGTRG